MSISVDITDTVTPYLRRLRAGLKPSRVTLSMAGEVREEIVDHFTRRNARPNRNHFPKSNYWHQAAEATDEPELVADGAVISIRHRGLALHYYGGTVRPTKNKNLAIPARAEAYGKWPRAFNNLRFVIFASGAKALITDERARKQARAKGDKRRRIGSAKEPGLVMYWLRPFVDVPRDPDTLPSDAVIEAAARRGFDAYLEELT
ncbi:MAG: hypothetical protein LBK76_04505 [Verrucomicrobiales bacterium]|jgi:hypothetical protein|nr:hypothetical protein [Verrucomicrobiales bacterium]